MIEITVRCDDEREERGRRQEKRKEGRRKEKGLRYVP
jgi:hypothetical protein